MAEETRMSKYKDLRETIDGDADYVPEQEDDDGDDDFLAFLPKRDKHENLEPKTYETLKYENDPFESLHDDKGVMTKNTVDTRLDILTKIKQDADTQETIRNFHTAELKRGHAVEGSSLMEKLAAMSPEEDVEAFRKYSEEVPHREPVKTQGMMSAPKQSYERKHGPKKAPAVSKKQDTKLTKVLNGVVAALVIAVIVFMIMTLLNI